MANDLSKHLTAEDLNRLVSSRAGNDELANATAHCEQCSECAAMWNDYRNAEEKLRGLKNESGFQRSESCPMPEEWAQLSIGAVAESRMNEIIDHAVDCSDCAAQLRVAFEDAGGERAAGEALSTNHAAPRTKARAWAWVAAMAAVVLVFGLAWWRTRSATPQALLAQAYSEARPFEMRYPGAAYGPIRNSRSAEGSLSRPKSLLDAEIKIRELPGDDRSLSLKGSLELLGRHYDAAIRLLEQARASSTSPEDTPLLLAIALFQRGTLFPDRKQDFIEALNLLQEFLAKHPGDSAAWFDLALCYEAVEDLPAAVETWKKSIAIDSGSLWNAEARDHLNRIEKRLRDRGGAMSPLDTGPDAFVRLAKSGVAYLPEVQLQVAIVSWLPHLGKPQARLAVETLANVFHGTSSDLFLAELLAARPSATGFSRLAGAVEANRRAMHGQALIEAKMAEGAFAAVENTPGVLRARAENLYALHRLFRSECLDAGTALDRALQRKPYSWLRVQVRLELANCYAFRNEYGRAAKAAGEARQWAREFHLPDLELRATGLLAAFHFYAGDVTGSMRECLPAMAAYWQSAYPPNRAQQCFHDLSLASEQLGWHYAASAFARAKIAIMLGTQEVLVEARGRVNLARLCIETGDYADARIQLEEARKLFDASPGSTESRPLAADAEVDRAAVEIAQPNVTGALVADLSRIAGDSATSADAPTEETRLRALELLARAHLKQGKPELARRDLQEAIRVHRTRLLGLTSAWERAQSSEQYAGIYRLLAQVQFASDGDPKAAFYTWAANRAPIAVNRQPAPTLQTDRNTLAISCLPDGPVVWAVSGPSIAGWRIAETNDQLKRESEQLISTSADPATSAANIETQARALKERIFAGAPHGMPSRFDAVDLDGCVGAIPVSLVFPGGVTRSGLRYLETPRRRLEMAEVKSLIISSPQLGGEMGHLYSFLPDAQRESSEVAALLRTTTVLSGREATLEGLERHRRGVSLVHFAGHGIGFGGNGSLLMAPRNFDAEDFELLSAPAIGKQDWRGCELAVLSACSTAGGAGPAVASANLVRAFLAAGAHRVVASLWNVDSGATCALMEAFYRNLNDGMNPPQALALASAAVRAQPQWSHPYYWAAFQIYGET